MKTILIHLEDREYRTILQKKGERTWKDLLLNGCGERDGSPSAIKG